MPKHYGREFRRPVCARLVAGEKVSSLSPELGVSEATLYKWKRQALIDAGRADRPPRLSPSCRRVTPRPGEMGHHVKRADRRTTFRGSARRGGSDA